MVHRLQDKVAIITGAAGGQGRAGAIRFAREGAELALCDIDGQGLGETAELIRSEGPAPLTSVVDMASVESIGRFVADVVSRFSVIDIIYNNAGVAPVVPIQEMTEDLWDRVHAINVRGPFFLVKSALPALQRSKSAAILNVASVAGLLSTGAGTAAYSASKGALIAMTRVLAEELSVHNIRVNAIAPGPVDTPMTRGFMLTMPAGEAQEIWDGWAHRTMLDRWGTSEEMAAPAVFLCSDEASYITGLIMPVDGGWSALA